VKAYFILLSQSLIWESQETTKNSSRVFCPRFEHGTSRIQSKTDSS
jgi:hypothetical protein